MNKKLITNNTRIVEYDFYSRDNIFVLGKDDMENLNKFLNSSFCSISDEIKKRYSYGEWLRRMH